MQKSTRSDHSKRQDRFRLTVERIRTIMHTIFSDWKKIAGILCVCIVVFLVWSALILFPSWPVAHADTAQEVYIQKGMTPGEIANLLTNRGIIPNERRFLLGAKLLGVTKQLQAGEYAFSGRMSVLSVLRKLVRGRVVTDWITFPEGIRATTTASLLQARFAIDSVSFMSLVLDSSFCRELGIAFPSLEGYLYPDTYRIQKRTTAEAIIRQMVSRFFDVFDESLVRRAEAVHFTVHDVVTLASIIEGEAALDDERPLISALYWNRLHRGMRLQADPTIQYIISDGPRRLLNRDLEIDSPYNTYLYSGLPPGPVNNPGRASLVSALYPDSADYLYMVANGDGSHTFSNTIKDHLEAKKRLDRLRRELDRNR